jgi:hypothetical protein
MNVTSILPLHEVHPDHVTETTLAHVAVGASPVTSGHNQGKVSLWRVENLDWEFQEVLILLDCAQVHALIAMLQNSLDLASSVEVQS